MPAREHESCDPRAIEPESSFGETQKAFDDRLVMRRIVDHEPLQARLVGERHVGCGPPGICAKRISSSRRPSRCVWSRTFSAAETRADIRCTLFST